MDYLNQIAPEQKQATVKPWILWAAIGGVLLVVIVFFFMIINSGSSDTKKLTNFVYRVQALQALTAKSQKDIQSSKLRASNSSLNAALINASSASAEPLAKAGIKKLPEAPKKSPITTEYTKLASTLDDARLNAQYDIVYSREIAYQIELLNAEMKSLYANASSKSLKQYLEKVNNNLKPLYNDFSNFK